MAALRLVLPQVRGTRHACGQLVAPGAAVNRIMLVQRTTALAEYWMRCELCFWSGPWSAFVTGEDCCLGQTIDVCERCMGDEFTVQGLLTCGWRFK
jgi:hypothetical protein